MIIHDDKSYSLCAAASYHVLCDVSGQYVLLSPFRLYCSVRRTMQVQEGRAVRMLFMLCNYGHVIAADVQWRIRDRQMVIGYSAPRRHGFAVPGCVITLASMVLSRVVFACVV